MIAMSFRQFINYSLSNFGQPYQIKNLKKISFSIAPNCTNDINRRLFIYFKQYYISLVQLAMESNLIFHFHLCPCFHNEHMVFCFFFLQSLDSREKRNLLLQKTGKLIYQFEKERGQSQQEQCSWCLLKPRRNCQEKGCYCESARVSEGGRGEEGVLQLLNSSIFPGSDRGFSNQGNYISYYSQVVWMKATPVPKAWLN